MPFLQTAPSPRQGRPAGPDRFALAVAALLLAAVLGAYLPSLHAGYVFDDVPNIVDNPTIKAPTSLNALFHPPPSIAARPLLNLSFAATEALGDGKPPAHRLFNILVHAASALFLFGIARRLMRTNDSDRGDYSAAGTALLWALAPVNSMAVTYIVQRAESLSAFFLFGGLYAAIRATESRRGLWTAASLAAYLVGLLVKEPIAILPGLILLHDGLKFGRDKTRWKPRVPLYLGFGACLVCFGLAAKYYGSLLLDRADLPFSHLHYILTQPTAVFAYLARILYPVGLVFDYGLAPVCDLSDWPRLVAMLALIAAAVVAALLRPRYGFWALWFFIALTPTSLLAPIRDLAFEYRVYAASAGIVALVCLGIWSLAGRLPHSRTWGLAATGLLAAASLALTIDRNRDYVDEHTLWADTLAKRPQNPRAWNNLGAAILDRQGPAQALGHFEKAVALDPNYADALANLGLVELKLGRPADAQSPLKRALDLKPNNHQAANNLGAALLKLNRAAEAAPLFRRAVQQNPLYADAYNNLGAALLMLDDPAAAAPKFKEALRLKPGHPDARRNLDIALGRSLAPPPAGAGDDPKVKLLEADRLLKSGAVDEAVVRYQTLLKDHPLPEAMNNLAAALIFKRRFPEAATLARKALAAKPDYPDAAVNLGLALLNDGKPNEAASALDSTSNLDSNAKALGLLGAALIGSGKPDAALLRLEQALSLAPNRPDILMHMCTALEGLGRIAEAKTRCEAALALKPDYAEARKRLNALGR